MPPYWCLACLLEFERTRCKAPSSMLDAPILSRTPSLPFVWMTTTCPGPQFLEQPAIDRVQCLLAAHGGVVIGPAFDFGVQLGNQCGLRRLLVVVDDGSERPDLALDVRFAWLDDGLEPERLASAVVRGVRLANSILAYLKPQKVKPDGIVVAIEGMRDPGFARFQFQSHLL